MAEQELDIIEKNGFKNIYPKPKGDTIKGLEFDNYIIVEKLFAEGREINGKFGSYYSAGVLYKNQEVSFLLNEAEHNQYAQTGGIGDRIKVTCFEHKFKFNNMNGSTPRLKFELVE